MANRASRSVTRRGLADAAAERSVCTTRQSDVKTWVYRVMALGLACALLPLLRASSAQSVNSLITGVERRYNAAQTLAVEFSETYSILGRAKRPESGTLVLRKPGRMRWSYNQPPGKLFVSDGKQVFLYTPEDNRAEKSTLKASDDMRAPMAFLLGKLNFRKEFKAFEAANDRMPYEKVSMLIAPGYSIKQLRITGRDQSELGFTLSGEVLNPKVNAAEFQFVPPPGTEIVDAVNTGSEGS
jgi:outer membrane lipoprotein carrier protein